MLSALSCLTALMLICASCSRHDHNLVHLQACIGRSSCCAPLLCDGLLTTLARGDKRQKCHMVAVGLLHVDFAH